MDIAFEITNIESISISRSVTIYTYIFHTVGRNNQYIAIQLKISTIPFIWCLVLRIKWSAERITFFSRTEFWVHKFMPNIIRTFSKRWVQERAQQQGKAAVAAVKKELRSSNISRVVLYLQRTCKIKDSVIHTWPTKSAKNVLFLCNLEFCDHSPVGQKISRITVLKSSLNFIFKNVLTF